jgi:hypothetical protein
MVEALGAMALAVGGTLALVAGLLVQVALCQKFEAALRQWEQRHSYRIIDLELRMARWEGWPTYSILAADQLGNRRRGWLTWPHRLLGPAADEVEVYWDHDLPYWAGGNQ